MTLPESLTTQIPEIADMLQSGMISYVHRLTHEVLTMGSQEMIHMHGDDPWEADRERVFEDPSAWISVEKPTTTESFRIMADFAENEARGGLQKALVNALNRGKPFRNFKEVIESSDARDEWFAFRDRAYAEYVRNALERGFADVATGSDPEQ